MTEEQQDFKAEDQQEFKAENEYGEYANDGMEENIDLNITLNGNSTAEAEAEKTVFQHYPKSTFVVCSLIGVGLFAAYMKWEEAKKMKKPEGVVEVNNTGWSQNEPEDFKKSGNASFKAKDYKAAIDDYTIAINLSKKKPSAVYFVNRANAHYELKNYNQCILDCNEAFAIDPDYAKQFWRVANALYKVNKFQQSLSCLDNAKALPAFANSEEGSAFMKFYRDVVFKNKQDEILAYDSNLRKMFIAQHKWYASQKSDLSNVEQVFDRKSPNPLPSYAPTQDIPKGEIILTWDVKFLITKNEMCKTGHNKHLLYLEQQGEKSQFGEYAAIYLHQISTQKDKSEFADYVNALGYFESNQPHSFTSKQLALLKGSRLARSIDEDRKSKERQFNNLKAKLNKDPEGKEFKMNLNEYLKFYYMAQSRQFTYPDSTVDENGDCKYSQGINLYIQNMMQIGTKSNCFWKRPRDTSFISDDIQLIAGQDLKQGETLILKIPETADLATFFIQNGIIDDTIPVKANVVIPINDNTPHGSIKQALLLNSSNVKEFNISTDNLHSPSWKLMINWARFVSYKGDPVELANANNRACGDEATKYCYLDKLNLAGFNGLNMFPVDVKQEILAWQLIKTSVQNRLQDYPESLEFDERFLSKDNIDHTERAIVEFRKKEKEALNFVIIGANWVMRVLNMTKQEAQQELDLLQTAKSQKSDLKWYFTEIVHLME